jgi:hypothetical protein
MRNFIDRLRAGFRSQIYLLETPICRMVGEIGAKIDNQTRAACN